jgi:hypothetical protein
MMVLSNPSLPFFFFFFVKESLSRMNLEILILHFENKNCFSMSLKQFAFEILQLLGYFLGKEMIYSCVGNVAIDEGTSGGDLLLLWVSKMESSRFCLRKISLF